MDLKKWTPDPSKKLGDSHSKKNFSIGRLAFSKGFDVLLKSLAIVKSQGISFQLKIAGEGTERPLLETLMHDLDLDSDVVLLGCVSEDQCLEEMRASDLFVSASRTEGFSVARQEAMAVEVATIDTDIKGANELILDGVNGLLVPPEQPESLADAISRLLTDNCLREQIARAGYQTMIEKFDSRLGAATLQNLILQSSYANKSLNRNEA